jgi:hypothetical protein
MTSFMTERRQRLLISTVIAQQISTVAFQTFILVEKKVTSARKFGLMFQI